MRKVSRENAAALFLARQGLSSPRAQRLCPEALARFAEAAGGVQLDSINVVERAHRLTLWSRFGAYDAADLDRWVYGERALVEYWAHAACLVPRAHLPAWRRMMVDYETRHTGWSGWLKRNASVLAAVEAAVREKGPVKGGDLPRPAKKGKGAGWWDWDETAHALHYLWMAGRLGVAGRVNFEKVYDLAERVLPPVEPMPAAEFPAWHLRTSLAAMGAASAKDLALYMTFPRQKAGERAKALQGLLSSGEAVPVSVGGETWYALAEHLPLLESPPAARGTTLLSPFDSLMWHRGRVRALFGFDYRIEVYTPAPKRRFGYYVLPILHEGRLVGRLDPKNHRDRRVLEVRAVHLEPGVGAEGVMAGMAEALRSLAGHLKAERVSVTARSRPAAALRAALACALLLLAVPSRAGGKLGSFEQGLQGTSKAAEKAAAALTDVSSSADGTCASALCLFLQLAAAAADGTLEYAAARRPHLPLLPLVRLDLGYQRVYGNIDSATGRVELGRGLLAAAYEHLEFREHDPPDRMMGWRAEALYRMVVGEGVRVDAAAGYMGFRRDEAHAGAQTGLSVGYYAGASTGFEGDFRWGSIGDATVSDWRGRLYLSPRAWRGVALRPGYRATRTGDTTLHGPELTVSYTW